MTQRSFLTFSLSILLLPVGAVAQQQGLFSHDNNNKPKFSAPLPYKIFHLSSMTEQSDANEVLAAVRRVIDSDSVTLMGIQNDLLVIGSPEQLKAAEDVISTLDKPRPLYHLNFTVTETTAGKTTVRHDSVYTTGGQGTQIKSMRWMPMAPPPPVPDDKGRLIRAKADPVEVGMLFDLSLDEYAGGVRMRSKVTYTGISTDTPPAGTTNPIIEENEITNTSLLKWNKPIVLGIIDPPNSMTHIEISVQAEQQLP